MPKTRYRIEIVPLPGSMVTLHTIVQVIYIEFFVSSFSLPENDTTVILEDVNY